MVIDTYFNMESLSLPEMFDIANSTGPRFEAPISSGGMAVLPYITSEISRFGTPNQEVCATYFGHPNTYLPAVHTHQESLDSQLLNSSDDSLADLEPEASDDDDSSVTGRLDLTEEQQVCI